MEASWLLFAFASVAIILTPGQDMILVMSRSLSQGSAAGVTTAAGVSTGLMGHTVLATLGLGALLQTSELLFTVLKLVGAGYLIFLGVRMVWTRDAALRVENRPSASPRRLLWEGAFSNLSNPKIALFYFAFLPQFVPATAARPALTLLVLGTAFAALTFLIKGPIGLAAGRLSRWIRTHPQVLTWLHRVSGTVLIGLGLRLAFEEQR